MILTLNQLQQEICLLSTDKSSQLHTRINRVVQPYEVINITFSRFPSLPPRFLELRYFSELITRLISQLSNIRASCYASSINAHMYNDT
jgi:hypothetical protein